MMVMMAIDARVRDVPMMIRIMDGCSSTRLYPMPDATAGPRQCATTSCVASASQRFAG